MSDDLDARVLRRLERLRAQGLERRCPLPSRTGVEYELAGRAVVGFCSNDYLGLAASSVASDLPQETPFGATASRLVCGDSEEHRALERALASLVGCEDAVLFSSGFAANVGALPALIEPDDHVFSDALNHASMIDGLRLARARVTITPHGASPRDVRPSAPAVSWWITESVHSMAGDRVSIEALAQHLDHGGLVYLDEAHGLGLFAGGAGLARAHGLTPTVVAGPLGKSFACAGAFVASSRAVAELLRSAARSFVFSTGLSPLLVEAIRHSLSRVTGPEGDQRRALLWDNIAHLGERLGLADVPESPIIPIHVGDNRAALRASELLFERGWHVQAIRPPTVPPDTARLRVSVSAAHSASHIDAFARDLRSVFSTLGLRAELRRAS